MSIRICGAFCSRAENDNYHMDRPEGEPVYLFLHFCDPVAIVMNGETIITKRDACVIYSPGTTQEYYSLEGGFVNDYVKFTLTDEDYFTEKALPMNSVFYIEDDVKIKEKISFITWALTDVMYDHSQETASALDDIMCELCRIRKFPSPKSQRDNRTAVRLNELRSMIRNAPSEWTVEKMSEAFYLTRSHFTMLYHKHFGISPREDLVSFRIDYAKRLLVTTDMDIAAVSESCGYKNCENFIRVFKKHCGITPLQYRNTARVICSS